MCTIPSVDKIRTESCCTPKKETRLLSKETKDGGNSYLYERRGTRQTPSTYITIKVST